MLKHWLKASLAVWLLGAAAYAQAPAKSTNERLLDQWNDINGKLVKMAEEFPAQKFEYKPAKDVRSFADQLRHAAFWNSFVAQRGRGEKPDGKPNQLTKEQAPDKAAIVAALKRSTEEGAETLRASTDLTPEQIELWTGFIEHCGEHYGQLVVYYRLNGIVPPASRPQK